MASPSRTAIPTPTRPPAATTRQAEVRPRLHLRHPGYGDSPDNILLTLPAVDNFDDGRTSTQTRAGLHHRTLLTAGAIIADNAFERAYLTRDQAGTQRVQVPLDGMLEPGDYWLQLDENEPRCQENTDTPPIRSMPPPPQPIDPPTVCPPPPLLPYPVVPSFRDWRFPHDALPPQWKHPQQASDPSNVCCVTGYRMAKNKCHLIPSNQSDWFVSNGMHQYASTLPGRIGDKANVTLMRADIHLLFDQHRFVIIPKPSSPSLATPPTQGSEPGSYALVTHVLKDDEESGELHDLYHNVAIQPSKLIQEFLFARFAWSLFSHLQTFLESPTHRYLTVRHGTESHKWMNNKDWVRYQAGRGDSRDGPRKRSLSQMTRDKVDSQHDHDDDVYQERRGRRSSSLDIAERDGRKGGQLEENTRWYDEVGQYAGNVDPEEKSIEENIRWYIEVGRFAAVVANDNDDDHTHRGRSPTARCSRHSDSKGTPRLSSSVTTCGSNKSSGSFAEEEEDEADCAMIANSANPNDEAQKVDEP